MEPEEFAQYKTESSINDYILEPPENPESNNAGLVILCIYTSGSMCVTDELPAIQSEWKNIQSKH